MILRCSDLHVAFETGHEQEVPALAGISFETGPREFLAVVGPSGCGKTTLLRALARLIPPTHGYIDYVTPESRNGGPVLLVYQEDNLFPWMTVLQNTTYGMAMQGIDREVRDRQARELLRSFGLNGRESAYPYMLSLGMKQRVAIIRAFLSKPAVLLMDEPFAALDYQLRLYLQQELLSLWEQDHSTVVFVTHDVDEAILLSDRILVLSHQPGAIIAEHKVPFSRPRTGGMVMDRTFLQLKQTIIDQLGLERLRKPDQ